MARWTDCYLLRDVRERKPELRGHSGVYELGYVRLSGGANQFRPLYVGKAKDLYSRLSSYVSDRCHNDLVLLQHTTGHLNIWYHTFRTSGYAESEARLQKRFGVRASGLYIWNKKLESLRVHDAALD